MINRTIWLFLLCGALLSHICGQAQVYPANFNLVRNGSFEMGDTHVIDTSFVTTQNCWYGPTGRGHAIWENGQYYNWLPKAVYQAHTGTHAVCMQQWLPGYRNPPVPTRWQDTSLPLKYLRQRAYLQTELLEPLQAGQTYYITMYVGAGKKYKSIDKAYWTTDFGHLVIANMGVYFAQERVLNRATLERLNVTPQINFIQWSVPVDDSFMYTRLRAAYTATGGERYITIGNFDYFNNYVVSYSDSINISGDVQFIYPFVDDISLVSDTLSPMISLDNFTLGKDRALCDGMSVSLEAPQYYENYSWNTGGHSRSISTDIAGIYWCTAGFGCGTVSDTIVVYEPPLIAPVDLGKDTNNCIYNFYLDTITLAVADKVSSILWSTGAETNVVKAVEPGLYWVKVYNECYMQSDTIVITGCSPAAVDHIAIPNAFTPNADGRNDVFRIPAWPVQVTKLTLKIYNRYGQLLKDITSAGDYWDGAGAEIGTYFYLLEYEDSLRIKHMQKGDITLLR